MDNYTLMCSFCGYLSNNAIELIVHTCTIQNHKTKILGWKYRPFLYQSQHYNITLDQICHIRELGYSFVLPIDADAAYTSTYYMALFSSLVIMKLSRRLFCGHQCDRIYGPQWPRNTNNYFDIYRPTIGFVTILLM